MTEADKPAFLQAVARLAIALREKEPDVVTLRVYFDALRDLEIEFVVAAAARFITSGQWFPKVKEWRTMAGRIETERRQAHRALLSKLPTPLCEACADTGWIRNDENRVSRCACHEMRRLEVLGRREWPALPGALTGVASAPVPDPQQPLTQTEACGIIARLNAQSAIKPIPQATSLTPRQSARMKALGMVLQAIEEQRDRCRAAEAALEPEQ